MKKYVQSYICNFTFANTIEELIKNVEKDNFLVEEVINNSENKWTVPKWTKKDDIVFFMFAKTAVQKITKLRSYYKNNIHLYSKKEQKLIEYGINHGLDLYRKYGGKIIAIGRVKGCPYYDNELAENEHWKGRIYALITDVCELNNPIDISEFNSFIQISRQSSITMVLGKYFEKLKSIIVEKNDCPEYLLSSISTPLPLKSINETNWLNLSNLYRRQFFREMQFRTFYVDYFLKYLSDDNKVYMECRCKKNNCNDAFVDNVIKYCGNYLCVEVKLNKDEEKNINCQLEQYCNCDEVELPKKGKYSFYKYSVLLIDTDALYIYNSKEKTLQKIVKLDSITETDALNQIRIELVRYLV